MLSTVWVFSGRCGNETVGFIVDKSISITLSYSASSSATYSLNGRLECSFIYCLARSSTGNIPFLAPASIAIFAIVNRSSIERLAIPSPVNSIDWYKAPSTPIIPIICKITSLPLTHVFNLPVRTNWMADGTLNHAFPVAMPAAISVEPTPVENAPSAPYVHVCESAPIITSPATVKPCSGSSACSIPICPTSK